MKSKWQKRFKENVIAYSMAFPALFLFVLFLILPLCLSVYISFFDYSGVGKIKPENFIGIKNFLKTVRDTMFYRSLWTTVKIAFFNGLFSISIGFVAAYCLYRRVKGWKFYSVALYVPALIMESVTGILWRQMFEANNGLINVVLRAVGLGEYAQAWLGDPKWALTAGIVVTIWAQIPFVMLVLYSALLNVPKDILEAARIDGANERQQMLRVTLPNIIPIISFLFVLTVSSGFRSFGMLYVMTGGGPASATMTTSIYIFKQASTYSHYGYANAIAFEAAIFVGVVMLALQKMLKALKVME